MAETPQHARPLNWSTKDLPDLAGKVALVTGGNSLDSIGGNIVHQLALLNAKVYVGGRSSKRVQEGIDAMLAASPSLNPNNLVPFVADQANWTEVKQRAEHFLKEEDRLDILVNNGGVWNKESDINEFGVEAALAINHISHFILTTTLLPLFSKTASTSPNNSVRIVNVSSNAHALVPPTFSFAKLEDWNTDFSDLEASVPPGAVRYGVSKAANILFSKELQRRLDVEHVSIVVTAVHPGEIQTNGSSEVLGKDSDFYKKNLPTFQGALTPLLCAASEEVDDTWKGRYVVPFGAVEEAQGVASDEKEATILWSVTEEILKKAKIL